MKAQTIAALACLCLLAGCGKPSAPSPQPEESAESGSLAADPICTLPSADAWDKLSAECVGNRLSRSQAQQLGAKLQAWARLSGSFPREILDARFTRRQFPTLRDSDWACLRTKLCDGV